MPKKKLTGLRQKIDSLDDHILKLLNERAEVVIDVGHLKEGSSADFYVPSREQEIYARLIAEKQWPLP